MPYIISPKIQIGSKGEWLEGSAYEKENLYKIEDNKMPPVNYDKHILKAHSLTHIETPLHTQSHGSGIDFYFKNKIDHFYGKCIVLKFDNNNWIELESGMKHKIISLNEIQDKLEKFNSVEKVLISVDSISENEYGYHDPRFILTLSPEAAEYLISFEKFNLFGTSWKSTDFMPRSKERPIHNIIFKQALILEYVNLNAVSEGEYFINCFPLNLEGASESPVTAVLFDLNEV